VLYQNTEQHSADCNRFPFESIPRRVFLDTNVINVLVKHSAHIFEQEPIPSDVDPTLAIDIEALMICSTLERGPIGTSYALKRPLTNSRVRETGRSATISWSTHWDLLTGISATKIAGSPPILDVG
jgi:hypothetical protein